MHKALRQIKKKICNNGRKLTITRIGMLYKYPLLGMTTLFGPGHHGIVRGQVMHII